MFLIYFYLIIIYCSKYRLLNFAKQISNYMLKENSLLSKIEEIKFLEKVENPKISIIVPVYNAEAYIERCIYYLILQTIKEIEIILVNDGSTDNTMTIIRKIAKKDGRIKILEQDNKLQGAARNKGLSIATGEYIGFCDADDYIDFEYYEKLYNAAKKYDADIALAENVRVSKTKYKPRLNITKEEVLVDIIEKFNACNQKKNECPTNKIYRSSYLKKNNILFPEGVYCEDKLFSVKSVYYSNKIVTVPDIHYYYWENPNSTVNSRKTNKHIQDRCIAKKAVLDFVKEKKIPVKNWYFKAEKKRIGFYHFPMIVIQESTESEKWFLFGIFCVYEKKFLKQKNEDDIIS